MDDISPPAFTVGAIVGASPTLTDLQWWAAVLPVSMIAVDPAGIVLVWNASAETLYGWTAEEAIGRPVGQLIIPCDDRVPAEAIWRQLFCGRSWEGEYRVRRRDGQERSLHVINTPMLDDRGQLAAVVGRSVDVTEWRQASRAVLQAVIENAPVSVTMVGQDDRIQLTMGDRRGDAASRAAHVGRHLSEVLADPSFISAIDGIRSGRVTQHRQVVQSRGRTYDTTAVAVPGSVADAGSVAVIATDITDQVAMGRRFEALVENLDEVTAIIDAAGAVLYVNSAVERIFGYPAAELAGVPVCDFIHPDDAAAAWAALQAVLDAPEAVVCRVIRVRHGDGSWRDVEQTLTNRLGDAAIAGIVAVSRDVTERLASERRLQALTDQMVGLNRIHAVLSEVGAATVRTTTPTELLTAVCASLVTTGEFAAAAFTSAGPAGGDVELLAECHARAGDGLVAATRAAIIAAADAPGFPIACPAAAARRPSGTGGEAIEVLTYAVERRQDLSSMLAVCAPPGSSPLTAEGRELLAGLARDVGFALDALVVDGHRADAMRLAARRSRQQQVVSTLGLMALGRAAPGEVADATVRALASFGMRQAVLYETLADDNVLVRALSGEGAAVRRGQLVARSLIPMTAEALASGQPAVVDDFSLDARYGAAESRHTLLTSGSGIAVPVLVNAQPVGALAVHSGTPKAFDAEDVSFYESVAHVISGSMERSRYEDSIRHDAMHDRLTGLPNRSLLEDRLAQALARPRHARPAMVGVIVVNLDGFKTVNETIGHEGGDRLLVLAGERVGEAIRPGDTAARVGADEFIVLCQHLGGPSEAVTVAERICRRLEEPFTVDDQAFRITASAGIAVSTEESTAEGLLRDADLAMHSAKQSGRGRCELVDDALRSRLRHRMELEQALRHAVERDQFHIAYQPIVDLASGDVREAEALLRWTREDGTPISPAEFIPIAEETGMIAEIGTWVLARACEDAVRWNASFGADRAVGVGVNLSARQIADPGVVATVVRALETAGLDPGLLRLEITETALMEDAASATATLEALDQLGVRLSVDDFGTGYSSLLYLRRFPVRVLKVDRYFVAGLGRNPEDDAIVQAVIALAHALGLTATAEGVETGEQLHRLRALRCDSAQGFLWARAVPFDDFLALIESLRTSGEDPLERAGPATPVASAGTESRPGRCPVVIVDDSPSDRGLLRLALESSGHFEVVGEAADGQGAIDLATKMRPAFLLLDMSMTGMSGLEALGPIRLASPETRVVFLSGFLSGALASAVSRAGAFAQFDKSIPFEALVTQLIALTEDADTASRADVASA
ncbi:MAG: EAL domain-containing protein [Candidatus Dormibacteria bacterium]